MSMTTCESHGDCVVVFRGYSCPYCDEVRSLEGTLKDKNAEVQRMDREIDELVSELGTLRERLDMVDEVAPEIGAVVRLSE